jgi:hypothetical protein
LVDEERGRRRRGMNQARVLRELEELRNTEGLTKKGLTRDAQDLAYAKEYREACRRRCQELNEDVKGGEEDDV